MHLLIELLQIVQDCCNYRTYMRMRLTCKQLYLRPYNNVTSYSYILSSSHSNYSKVTTDIVINDKSNNSCIQFYTVSQHIRYLLSNNLRAKVTDFETNTSQRAKRYGYLYKENYACEMIKLITDKSHDYFLVREGSPIRPSHCYIKMIDQLCFGAVGSIKILIEYLYYYIPELYFRICNYFGKSKNSTHGIIIYFNSNSSIFYKFLPDGTFFTSK